MVMLCTEYDALQFLSSGGEIASGFYALMASLASD